MLSNLCGNELTSSIFFKFLIGGYLLYILVLVSVIQQHESVISDIFSVLLFILCTAPNASLFALSTLFAEPGVGKRLEGDSRSHRNCRHVYSLLLFKVAPSVQFSRSVVLDSLRPHESQHARPPCPSPAPGVHSDSRPSSP